MHSRRVTKIETDRQTDRRQTTDRQETGRQTGRD